MRLNVGTKLVAAEKNVTAEERAPFAFEIKIAWQPADLIAVLLHPPGKMWRFASAFFVTKIARDKFLPHSQSSVRREHHVGKFRLWRDKVDLALQFRKRLV